MGLPESAIRFMRGAADRARKLQKTIVFPEGADPRVLEAAARLARDGVVQPILLGPAPADPPAGVTFADPRAEPHFSRFAAYYYERRRAKGVTQTEAAVMAMGSWVERQTPRPTQSVLCCTRWGRIRRREWCRASS
jgi:Phosphate acetyl/butaryl transferase